MVRAYNHVGVTIPPGTYEEFRHFAEGLDLATNHLIDAVLRGAVRTGQVERLASLALANREVRRRLRVAVRKWKSNAEVRPGPGKIPPASDWSSGPWLLRKDPGPTNRSDWRLFGPGLPPEGWPTGERARPEAVRAADARIAVIEAQAPIRVDEERTAAQRAADALAARVHG